MNVMDLLRRRPVATATSGGLRATLAEMEVARDAVSERVAALESRSGSVMLDGDDAAIDAHWDELREARKELERLGAVVAAMPARIAAADAAERAAQLDQLAAEADAAAAQWAKEVPQMFELIQKFGALADKLDAMNNRVRAANQTLKAAGRTPVQRPEHRLGWRRNYKAGSFPTGEIGIYVQFGGARFPALFGADQPGLSVKGIAGQIEYLSSTD
jgi:hypothetical protein